MEIINHQYRNLFSFKYLTESKQCQKPSISHNDTIRNLKFVTVLSQWRHIEWRNMEWRLNELPYKELGYTNLLQDEWIEITKLGSIIIGIHHASCLEEMPQVIQTQKGKLLCDYLQMLLFIIMKKPCYAYIEVCHE